MRSRKAQKAPESESQPESKAPELDRPRQKLKPADFFAAIAAYPDTQATMTYIYRRWPVIDRKLTGGENAATYIEKVSGPIDEGYVLRTWGSGEYRLRFNDENQARGKTEICNTILTVNEADAPPIIDTDELVLDHPQNKSFVENLRLRGVLRGGKMQQTAADPAASELATLAGEVLRGQLKQKPHDPAESVQNKALDLMAEASKQAIKIASEQAKGTDPVILKLLMDSQAKQQDLLLQFMKLQKEPAPSSLESDLEKYLRFSRLIDRVSGSKGGGLWDALVSHLPDLLDPLIRVLTLAAAARGGAPAQPPNPPAPAVIPAAPQPEPGGNPQPGGDMFVPPHLIAQLGAQLLDALQRDVSGDEFADSLVTFLGDPAYDRIAALGHDKLIELLRSVPDLWATLEPHKAKLDQFITDFLAYGEQTPDDNGKAS